MKKLIIGMLAGSLLFASSNDDINKKLDLLLQKIEQLEKKVDKKDSEIEQLKKELNQQQKEIKKQNEEVEKKVQDQIAVKSCDKIKVVGFKYKYHDDVIPYYDITVTLKNTYPKKIVFFSGDLFAEDKDGVKLLQDYYKRNITIPVGGEVTLHHIHTLNSDFEKYLKDEKPSDLRVYFKVIDARFADGTKLECGLF